MSYGVIFLCTNITGIIFVVLCFFITKLFNPLVVFMFFLGMLVLEMFLFKFIDDKNEEEI